jgi:hypothetical protein
MSYLNTNEISKDDIQNKKSYFDNFVLSDDNYIELAVYLGKLLFCVKVLNYFGIIYGIMGIILFFTIKDFIFTKIFNLEKLNTNELLLLGFNNKDRCNMICIFFFKNKIDHVRLQERFIEKGIKQNRKLRTRLVKFLGSYYWKEVDINQAIKRVRILDNIFTSKEDVINYARREIDNHIDILREIPYEFQIMNYNDGGAILYKLDHAMSDGLGMVTFTLTQADNFDESFIPNILKQRNSIPFYYKFFLHIVEIFTFPYYAVKLLANHRIHESELNPFTRNCPPSGESVFDFTKQFDFNKIHKMNKKLNITFNDLMLGIISTAMNKYGEKYKLPYKKQICAIPVGIKNIPKDASEVSFKNEILGAIAELKRISDPIKDSHLISEETKKTVKNSANTTAW